MNLRIIGMDVGDRRIGMAVSDEMGWTAQGIGTLERKSHREDMERLKEIFSRYNPKKVILGLPKNMDGSLGPQSGKVKEFGEFLQSHIYEGEIVYWDERLTTILAHRIMIDADMSRQKRKQRVDQMAAVFILQSYMDYLENQRKGD